MRASLPPQAPLSTAVNPLGAHRKEVLGAHRGSKDAVTEGTSAIVIGGGLAGTAAASVLAQRGVKVTLLEKRNALGGRLAGRTLTSSDGFQYTFGRTFGPVQRNHYNVRKWLAQIDPELSLLRALPGSPTVMRERPNGFETVSFADLPSTLPLNLLSLLRRDTFLHFSDLRGVRMEPFRQLMSFDSNLDYNRLEARSAGDFLGTLGLPQSTEDLLVTVFAQSGAESRASLSAAEFLTRLHFHFLSNQEGLASDVLEDPSSDVLWAPMQRYLESLGVNVVLGQTTVSLQTGQQVEVKTNQASYAADGVVLALDAHALYTLVQSSPSLCADPEFSLAVAEPEKSPYEVVARFFSRHAALAERLPYVQVTGSSVRSVELIERVEHESRRIAMRTGGSVVQVVAYSDEEPTEDLKHWIRGVVDRVYPELALTVPKNVLEEAWLVERVLPRFSPRTGHGRLRVATPFGNVALAGDFVRLPFPTQGIERAAASGFLASNLLLDRWDTKGETVYRIAPKGFLGSLRALWPSSGA